MRDVFDVLTSDNDAIRECATGHRARHYVVTAKPDPTSVEFADIRCELQVKTILQEAFDAKSHDLAYKPKKLNVSEKLNHQFTLLSTSLKALDGQSEFLKDLILSDKQEIALRRGACLVLYLEQEEVRKTAAELGLDVQNLPDVTTLANTIQQWVKKKGGVSREICKLAALCAIKRDNDYLRFWALRYADAFVNQGPAEARRYLVRGSTKWLLGSWEPAIRDVVTAIDMGAKQAEDHTVVEESKRSEEQ